jgi:serine/threonine protein kinase
MEYINNGVVINKCKIKQFNLIKNSPITMKQKNKIKIDYSDKIKTIYDEEYFKSNLKIVNEIYTRNERGTYIVADKNNNLLFLKVKCNDICHNDISLFNKMKNLNHKNLVMSLNMAITDKYTFFFYENVKGQDLWDYSLNNDLSIDEIKDILLQIIDGVEYLHNNNIIHCDLKLDNIMIDPNKKIKITDFDLSKVSDGEFICNHPFGTDQYIAPESYDLHIYSIGSDIWSIGIILFILISGKMPFGTSLEFIDHNSNMYRRNQFKHINMLPIKEKIGDDCMYDILKGMLQFNVDLRISLNDVRKKLQ